MIAVPALRLQWYLFRLSLANLALTLGVILLAILLVDVVEQMRTIGSRADIGFQTALELSVYKTPRLVYETLPFATLVGAILTYSGLNRKSEISAIRAAGVSAWRFLTPAIALSLMTGALMVGMLDPLATGMNRMFEERRDQLLGTQATSEAIGADIWLSQGSLNDDRRSDPGGADLSGDGAAIISAKRAIGRTQELEDVTFYYFRNGPEGGAEREFSHRIDARRAVLVPGFWQLTDAVENRENGDVLRHASLALPTTLAADTLLSRYASSRTIPFWSLPRFIRDTRSAGLETGQYVLKLHGLLATPFLLVAMTLIGALVCLRFSRAGGATTLVAAGATGGVALFFATRVAAGLSTSGAAPPEAAAWAPPLTALFLSLALIAYREDG
jgi:lipopolysaccharide export system permease protein